MWPWFNNFPFDTVIWNFGFIFGDSFVFWLVGDRNSFFVFFQRPVLIFDALPSTALLLLRRRHPTQVPNEVWNEGPTLNQSTFWNKRDSFHTPRSPELSRNWRCVCLSSLTLSRVTFVSLLCRMAFLGVVLAKRKWRFEIQIKEGLSFGASFRLIEFELLRYYYTVAVLL